jgi:ABC-2 type transport system permease protein
MVRAAAVFVAVVAFIGLHVPNANYGASIALLSIASVSFIGVGMMTAVLPLISPEKGTQLGFVAQGLMLVVSGVYYPVSVLPEWMQWISKISPATYALRGIRASVLTGAGLAWGDVWPLLVIGAFSIPIGLSVFGERAPREEDREAEAVRMIRAACQPAEFELSADIYAEVAPDGRITPEQAAASPGITLLHGSDGFAYVQVSSVPGVALGVGCVRPPASGHGVGSALLAAARERARTLDCAGMWGADARRTGLIRFATTRGFANRPRHRAAPPSHRRRGRGDRGSPTSTCRARVQVVAEHERSPCRDRRGTAFR